MNRIQWEDEMNAVAMMCCFALYCVGIAAASAGFVGMFSTMPGLGFALLINGSAFALMMLMGLNGLLNRADRRKGQHEAP